MFFGNHSQLGLAANIPVPDPSPVLSYSPIVLDGIPNRPAPLQRRVSIPWLRALADFLAGRGFAVIQPTFLCSKFYDPAKATPEEGNEYHWKTGVWDLTTILDRLDEIEAAVPGLRPGRLDRERIGIVGHSFGAATINLLMGVVNTDPRFPGTATNTFGGRDVRRKILPFYGPDFTKLNAPTLVVAGDSGTSMHLTTRGSEFHMDAYTLAPGPKDLLTLKGGLHCLGGVDGWDAVGTPDTDPQRLGTVQRMTWAYLRSQLYEGDTAWADACEALKGLRELGDVQNKAYYW
ncbi:alpha/beta-hydrolase [Apiospora aurea]|uniref:Alpha/beta-hydrolase n=1 Tax=Apiospora aurea TaxID=335848 RepID=A0ABR1PU41_9PEZI